MGARKCNHLKLSANIFQIRLSSRNMELKFNLIASGIYKSALILLDLKVINELFLLTYQSLFLVIAITTVIPLLLPAAD
jgi:hypothetical protein